MRNAFLDTNIIVRHLLQDYPTHSQRCSLLIERIAAGEVKVVMSDTVVFELVFVLNQIYGIPRADVAREIILVLNLPGISLENATQAIAALAYWTGQSPLSFADCYHLVLAKSFGPDAIYSFDKKMNRYPGVERVEP